MGDSKTRTPAAPSQAETIYLERQKTYSANVSDRERISDRLSHARMAVFVFAIVALVFARYFASHSVLIVWILAALGVISLIGFAVLVLIHQRVSEALERERYLLKLNGEAVARLKRDWEGLPEIGVPTKYLDHTVARDLDLFGPSSLYQLLCLARSPEGRDTLAQWLTYSGKPFDLESRQQAVAALAPELDWRQEISAAGRAFDPTNTSEPRAMTWQGAPKWILQRPWITALARSLPILLLLTAIGSLTGIIYGPWWVIVILINFSFTKIYAGKLRSTLHGIAQNEPRLRSYAEIVEQLEKLTATSPYLDTLRARLQGAHSGIRQLCHLATQADARSAMVYPLLQYGLLWDFHIARSMERWQNAHSDSVEDWLAALGEMEALASLAGLVHDEPAWSFPNFTDEKRIFAENMGHPLIAETVRVGNDVTIGPPGTFLLVTGSNMSGKSTLLRSIGVNVVLAQAGGPVCAKSLHLPSVTLATSMRVQDSLNAGVSFFMAELKRIQEALQLAKACAEDPTKPTALYLFDEILLGTNSTERQTIVHRVLLRLLELEALGIVTTHDLALAEIPDLQQASHPVHFREEFTRGPSGAEMRFDYRLRPGLATTTNALKLLEIMDFDLGTQMPPKS